MELSYLLTYLRQTDRQTTDDKRASAVINH